MLQASFGYFLVRAANGVISLILISLLTRLLSAEQYGYYALGMAAITLGGAALFQWLTLGIARFYAAHIGEPAALLGEVYRLFIAIAIPTLCLALGISSWLAFTGHNASVLVLLIAFGCIGTALHAVALQTANSQGRQKTFAFLSLSRGSIGLGLIAAFVAQGHGAQGAVLATALAAFNSVLLCASSIVHFTQTRNESIRTQLLSYGLPLAMASMATVILDISDRFLLAYLVGTTAVASYAATYDVAQQIIGSIFGIFFLAAYPRITAAWVEGGAYAARMAAVPLWRAIIFFTPLIVGISIGAASDLAALMFGAQIRKEASELIPWLACAMALGCLKLFYFDIPLQLACATRLQLNIAGLMALLNLALNLALIPIYGPLGSAMATAGAFGAGAIASLYFGRLMGMLPVSWRDVAVSTVGLAIVVTILEVPIIASTSPAYSVARLALATTSYLLFAGALDFAGVRGLVIRGAKSLISHR